MGNPTYWERKVSLLAFRQVLTKILPAACIQLHNYDLFEKAWLNLSLLPQNSDYLPERLSPRITCQVSPFLTKMSKNCFTLQVWTVLVWIFIRNPGDGGKSYSTRRNVLIFPIRKIPRNRFKTFAIKSLISCPSKSNVQVITLCNLHL